MAQQLGSTDELKAVVLQKIIDNVDDALERETKLCNVLTGTGKKQQKGGLLIQAPIKLLANTSQGAIAGVGANIDLSPSQQLQFMTFVWKYFVHAVNFTLQDYNIANGPEEIVDFMETKIEGALADATRAWSIMFNGSQSTNALNFSGIKDMFGWSGTSGSVIGTPTTYGGLIDSDYKDASGNFTLFTPLIWNNGATSFDGSAGFNTMNYNNFNQMTTNLRLRIRNFGKNRKVDAFCNGFVYSRLKTALQNQQIFINESDFIKAGFQGFEVDGVDVYPDIDAPGSGIAGTYDNYLYMFPEEIMKFWYHFGFGTPSKFDGKVRIPNTPVDSYQVFTSGEAICTNRRLGAAAVAIG